MVGHTVVFHTRVHQSGSKNARPQNYSIVKEMNKARRFTSTNSKAWGTTTVIKTVGKITQVSEWNRESKDPNKYTQLVFKTLIFYFFIVVKYTLSVLQLLSCVQLFVTPWTAARQAFLSFTIPQSLLKLMSVELVMPSNQFILCHSSLLLPSIFLNISIFSDESALRIRWPK